ncbi:hypothetical protein QE152_g38992, partial [Popillia japonica]
KLKMLDNESENGLSSSSDELETDMTYARQCMLNEDTPPPPMFPFVAKPKIHFQKEDDTTKPAMKQCWSKDVLVATPFFPQSKDAYGDDRAEQHRLSQPTLSTIVKRVVEAVAGHINEFIQFPEGYYHSRH